MPLAADRWMTEYPAWLPTDKGVRRVFALPGGPVLAEVEGDKLTLTALGGEAAEPLADVFGMPDGAAGEVPQLAKELAGLGQVGRFRNPSLWEALATAILRQVIRAGQSKKVYRELCTAHGEQVALPDGETYGLFPIPEKILDLEAALVTEIVAQASSRPCATSCALARSTRSSATRAAVRNGTLGRLFDRIDVPFHTVDGIYPSRKLLTMYPGFRLPFAERARSSLTSC